METVKTKISVIMGLYNCADTLPEAIDSLLNQTYKAFKVIMCDDGSTDHTYSTAKEYADKYDNFILLKNDTNLGLNKTLNKCLNYVDTEFVARMDADDISLPQRFELQIKFLETYKEFDFVSSPMIYFDEKGDFRIGKVFLEPSNYHFIKGTPFCHAPSMIRKKAYDLVGGYSEDKKLLRVEDYHLWFKMYSKNLKGANLQEPLYKMRDNRNAFHRRKFKYRVNEMYVKSIGYRMLKLPLYYQIYALKPILIGLLPSKFYFYLRNKANNIKENDQDLCN
ncbi:glycosyltransferase [Weeksellaceae bacterium TAE3-ERU29]|nr:glycosyltransferase [Weeksellaceae bacterium TAE3-ERU29]